jgi:hypothetical protein
VCDAYGGVRDAVTGLGAAGADFEMQTMLVDMADAYLLLTLEGDSMRLTPEARDAYFDWLHTDCA